MKILSIPTKMGTQKDIEMATAIRGIPDLEIIIIATTIMEIAGTMIHGIPVRIITTGIDHTDDIEEVGI